MSLDSPRPDTSGHGAQNRGERLTVVANPRAGGGRAGKSRDDILRAVDRAFAQAQVLWTEGPGHASELAGKAARESDIVAALGGDGTCSEVVNGLLPAGEPVNRRVIFSAIPFGTGGDLVRSLEVPKVLDRALWIAATGMTLPLDAGLLAWDSGARRVFVNVAGIGANADVCRRANTSSKRFGGQVTFISALLGTLREWSARRIHWTWDGPDGPGELEFDTFAAFCANGHYCGAGMWVGRGGSMADGLFDLTLVPPVGVRLAARLFPRIYGDGRLAGQPELRQMRVSTVHVGGDIPIEGDGETLASGPLRISVLPRALQVRGGWLNPPSGPAGASADR